MTNLSVQPKICFVLHPNSVELRDYSEQVFEFIIAEAVEPFGYRPIRADQISDVGFTSPAVIQHLAQDTLVIADLTAQSPQVLYGLAVRHATQKPVIHLIREGEAPLFEFAAIPTLRVSVSSARDAKRCKNELTTYIEGIEKSTQPQESPVSRALRRQLLEQSESLLDRRAAEMLRMLGNLQTNLSEVYERLSLPENILPQEHLVNALKNSSAYLSREEVDRAVGDVQNTLTNLTDRLAIPENILPQDYVANVIKNSGILLSREEVDRIMSDTFMYAEDAKAVLGGLGPELLALSKALYLISKDLSNHQNVPVDWSQIKDRVDQNASGIMHTQSLIGDTIQKLDAVLNVLSQFYRSLSKITM